MTCVSTCSSGNFEWRPDFTVAGIASPPMCETCPFPDCETCDLTGCLTCPSGFFRYLTSCVDVCPDGSYEDGTDCTICPATSECKTCDSTGCTECWDWMFLDSVNAPFCTNECEKGAFYGDWDTMECTVCPESDCLECNEDGCTMCGPNHVRDENTCVAACPPGKFAPETTVVGWAAPRVCEYCFNDNCL